MFEDFIAFLHAFHEFHVFICFKIRSWSSILAATLLKDSIDEPIKEGMGRERVFVDGIHDGIV